MDLASYISSFRIKRAFRLLGGLMVMLLVFFLLWDLLFPLPATKSYSQVVYAKDSTLLCAYLTEDEKWRLRTRLDQVNPDMVKAIITKEDKYFYYHPGVNLVAVVRAVGYNVFTGKRQSGASTITMQLARMAVPARRTYFNKIKEMFRAFQYEWYYTKDEILEMYLSYLPYGGNVEGVHSASYIYFDRPPGKLSLSQAILLAVIPNRPNSLRLDRNVSEAKKARDKWIDRFRDEKVFEARLLDGAEQEVISSIRFEIPPKTPHFCYELKNKYPEEDEVYSTLDLRIQSTVTRLLKNHVRRVKSIGVSNGAVMVIDNLDGSVAAYAGSADFADVDALGQVNGITAIRSPGSTLKPMVYAMAFDKGLVTPQMKLLDVPTNYRGFTPENYDLVYHGEVTTHFALSHSLNIPVVRLLKELGLPDFLSLAEKGGFETIHDQKEKLGLSVILGGCGITLEELTRFYTCFAREGNLYDLSYTAAELEDIPSPNAMFTPEATYMVGDILSQIERPDLPQRYLESTKLPKVAWKTGTSFGRRDAWSVGFSPRYTIGVWMGNFDGEGVPEMSGSSMAVPLLLDIFNAIDFNPKGRWFGQPPGVGTRKVCAETGKLPGKFCEHTTRDLFITTASPLGVCDLYKEIYVDSTESIHYCLSCLPEKGFKKLPFPQYPPELALWYEQNQVAFNRAPPHNPDCDAYFSGKGPKIISPSPDFEYLIEKGNEQEILLQAASGPDVTAHFWYVNGKFLKKESPTEKVFFLPKSGRLSVTCMDDKGRKDAVVVKVTYY